MGFKPSSRREALLHELYSQGGHCSNGLTPDDLLYEMSAEEIAIEVLCGEELSPGPGPLRTEVERMSSTGFSTPQAEAPVQASLAELPLGAARLLVSLE